MSWKLHKVRSACGEEPGSQSKIGFRGTRFSLSKANRLYLTDYQKNYCFAKDEMISTFCKDIRNVLGPSWPNARIRIRGNGDVYASGKNNIYVGRAEFCNKEIFPGYLNLKSSYDLTSEIPQVYAGPQTSGHPGEMWTIPSNAFAKREGRLGNVGKKYRKGDWIWSKSTHREFINNMKRRLNLGNEFIRFYITCDGLVVSPIGHNLWKSYGINIEQQLVNLNKVAPSAARSVQERVNKSRMRDDETVYLLFVIGHIDDLMNGNIPEPDEDDPRTSGVDER